MNTNGFFTSPTFGQCDGAKIKSTILKYFAADPESKYRIVIGSDSQPKNGSGIDFVTAIVVHRIGHGGIYFWKRTAETKKMVLRQRMYQEATHSLLVAEEFLNLFQNDGITKYDIEIHVDIGQVGETREMISEIVGMIRGSGFAVKTKPDAYGASKVADRHT